VIAESVARDVQAWIFGFSYVDGAGLSSAWPGLGPNRWPESEQLVPELPALFLNGLEPWLGRTDGERPECFETDAFQSHGLCSMASETRTQRIRCER